MGFVKVVKDNSYHSRYQVKYKRRRQGKTDYYARRRLCQQDKNKYDTKKYRFVVRRTNAKFICQIIFPTIQGDKVMCQANSTELKKFGLTAGLTNYASAYCTGLLCARRLLKNLSMDGDYKGVEKVDGENYDIYNDPNVNSERRPFKAFLDVGLTRTTTGNRVFGAMKGAVDGGVFIPHNNKRFPGYHVEKQEAVNVKGKKKKGQEEAEKTVVFNAEEHRERIFGIHVQKYMDILKKNDKAKFTKQFSQWEKCLAAAKVQNVEALYKKIHDGIRKAPEHSKKQSSGTHKVVSKKKGVMIVQNSKNKKWMRHFRLTREERMERVAVKMQKAMERMAA